MRKFHVTYIIGNETEFFSTEAETLTEALEKFAAFCEKYDINPRKFRAMPAAER